MPQLHLDPSLPEVEQEKLRAKYRIWRSAMPRHVVLAELAPASASGLLQHMAQIDAIRLL